jgi:hypothetical protein
MLCDKLIINGSYTFKKHFSLNVKLNFLSSDFDCQKDISQNNDISFDEIPSR